MTRIETITSNIRKSIIDKVNELAKEDFQEEESLKLPLIAYSLIDAAITYTVFMLHTTHGENGLRARKTDFQEEFQTYFINLLDEQIDNWLSHSENAKRPKTAAKPNTVINFEDYVNRK